MNLHTVSLVSFTVETVLGVATVEVDAVTDDAVNVARLVDAPLARRRELPSVPSPYAGEAEQQGKFKPRVGENIPKMLLILLLKKT